MTINRDAEYKEYMKRLPAVIDPNRGPSRQHCVPTTDSSMNDPLVRARYKGMRHQSHKDQEDGGSTMKNIITTISNLFHYW